MAVAGVLSVTPHAQEVSFPYGSGGTILYAHPALGWITGTSRVTGVGGEKQVGEANK